MAKPTKKTKKPARGAEPIAALFNLDKETERGAAVREVLAEQGIRVRTVTSERLNDQVGYIAGLPTYRPAREAFEGEPPACEFVLFCNVEGKLLDATLAVLRAADLRISGKAMMTKSNRDWSYIMLIEQVLMEIQATEATEAAAVIEAAEE